MTRTERAQGPAAISKDKHSRSGLTKTELSHKNGDGGHNWGSDRTKQQDELMGEKDASDELFNLNENININDNKRKNRRKSSLNSDNDNESNLSNSPNQSIGSIIERPNFINGIGGNQRRMSSYSEEEQKEAFKFRSGWNKNGVDLAQIARTSYGIAQSPPNNTYMSTSPTQVKSGFNFHK
ncbi:uncharacterized protein I206_101009 [Kwoniella pini CBS 10737]|uniref:Hyaluronan/mRNA-binding protein domain-containing protein n=1 Tax=Kwoniella pini CBS 10737 TaxID=1296096 RepID=A0A1B9IBU5_9TREE|nr:uncharacterized protein I206_00317 [Kwoniella pini CBS 10737]OCF53016.1 hypothetical protein I206_00317 [Kwoniella pini CBS 10737]